jgi:hypothetical protein
MKHLKHYESFVKESTYEQIDSIKSKDISAPFMIAQRKGVEETEKFQRFAVEYISKLSDSEKLKLKKDLEKFAIDNNVTLNELQDPKIVEELLKSKNEGFGNWVKENWYNIVDKISKYTGIAAFLTFFGSMFLYWGGGYETLDGVKVAAAAWIISRAVGILKGLK